MWRYTLEEIRSYTRIKVSEKQMEALQEYEVMAKILSAAFGGNKKETKIQNRDQLSMALDKMRK